MPEESAEEFLAQPSEQRGAVRNHTEYAGVSPHKSKKMAMVRSCIGEKSSQHLEDCIDVGTCR